MKKTSLILRRASSEVISLREGGDEAAASQLRTYVRDAEDGLRRVLICGAFLDHIVSQLPHGQLEKWMQSHAPDLPLRTVRAWRQLYQGVLEICGVKTAAIAAISSSPVALLAAPLDKLHGEALSMREKIEAQIQGKTAKQLFLEFKSADEDDDGNLFVKVGRRAGEGGRAPEPTSPTAQVELLRARSVRRCEAIAKELEALGAGFTTMPDAQVLALQSLLETHAKACAAWLRVRPEQRAGAGAVREIEKILRA
jgi:hypothetical protein